MLKFILGSYLFLLFQFWLMLFLLKELQTILSVLIFCEEESFITTFKIFSNIVFWLFFFLLIE